MEKCPFDEFDRARECVYRDGDYCDGEIRANAANGDAECNNMFQFNLRVLEALGDIWS